MTDKSHEKPTHKSHSHPTPPPPPASHRAHSGSHAHAHSHKHEGETEHHAKSHAKTKAHSRQGTKAEHHSKPKLHKVKPEHRSRLRFTLVGLFLVLALVGGFLIWKQSHKVSGQRDEQIAEVDKGPVVDTTKVKVTPVGTDVILEGESRPFFESTIYAKVSGYLSAIYVDAGSPVKAGQLLAKISSPEADQAYNSARAEWVNRDRIARRYKSLLHQRMVSAQEAEQAFTASATALAELKAKEQLRDYENVRAPFDGTVTARMVDPGALIPDASNSKTAQLAIVNVAQTEKLKLNAYVDQKYAPYIQANLPVAIFLPERTDEKFPGVVARVAGALDRHARMLPIEVDFDNSQHKIVPGSFVQVQLKVPSPSRLTVPAEALVTQDGEPAVAIVGEDKKIKMMPVSIIENDGTNVTFSDGPQKGALVALNLGSAIKDGQLVRLKSQGQGHDQGGQNNEAQAKGGGSSSGADSAAQNQSADKASNASASDDSTGGLGDKPKSDDNDSGGKQKSKKEIEKQQEKESHKPERGPGDS